MADQKSRVGMWYAVGSADDPYYPGHPKWDRHEVVSDTSKFPGCVTVRNQGGQEFPVHTLIIDEIAEM